MYSSSLRLFILSNIQTQHFIWVPTICRTTRVGISSMKRVYIFFQCANSYCFSMRVVPPDNDTTGFFCALLTKVKELPWIISKSYILLLR